MDLKVKIIEDPNWTSADYRLKPWAVKTVKDQFNLSLKGAKDVIGGKEFYIRESEFEELNDALKVCGYTLNKGEKKPAWSEEDERLCQCLIKDQEEALDTVRNDKYGHSEIISDLKEMYHERIDWLKSLRTRNTWKPSDEQMKALKAMARYCDIATSFDAHKQRIVESLYSELKKLKEE